MKKGTLDLSRRRRRRWPWAGAAVVLLCVCLPVLLRWADRALALHYTDRLTALEKQTAALRTELAAASRAAAENEALRTLLGSIEVTESLTPARTVGWFPDGFWLAGDWETGAAVLDRQGRYAGAVTGSAQGISTVKRGTPAGLVGGAVGLLEGGTLIALPLHSGLEAGAVVTVPGGHWLGALAEAPADGSLTASAELTDTADLADLVYFVCTVRKKGV